MKKHILLFIFLMIFAFSANSQVGIKEDNTPPDGSAMLDVKSNSKGFLPPRMSTFQMNAISSPAEGLMVYNTTLNALVFYNGFSWKLIGNVDGESCGNITYGGQTYSTVVIGMQCWMKENLNIGIAIIGSSDQTDNSIIEKYCYDDDNSNCITYGGLYQWDEVMNYTSSSSSNPSERQGICPDGWHLPSHGEWQDLISYLGGSDVAGGKMKETGITHWAAPNPASNSSGFTGLPGGRCGNICEDLNTKGDFWSTTEDPSNTSLALKRELYYDNVAVYTFSEGKGVGISVRCIKN